MSERGALASPAYPFRMSARDLTRYGRYVLIARSPTQFVVEDARLPLAFTLGADGRAAALDVWLTPDEATHFTRER